MKSKTQSQIVYNPNVTDAKIMKGDTLLTLQSAIAQGLIKHNAIGLGQGFSACISIIDESVKVQLRVK
jgi:hypothetical protein